MKKSELTRAKILRAAGRILAKKGFREARTAELALEAGLSEGALFRYFPTKNQLFEAVIRQNLTEFHQELEKTIREVDGESEAELLERIIDFHFGFFSWKEHIIQHFTGFGHPDSIDLPIRILYEGGIIPYVAKISAIINQGIKKGLFRPGDSDLMATALLGLMQVTLMRKIVIGASYTLEEAKNEAKQLFFTGILMQRRENK